LESVWNQTICPQEIIIVDDASTDGTADHVAELAIHSNVPLQLIRRESNYGAPSRPMNEGIHAAQGEFVCILDQDDVWLPTKLEMQSRVLEQMPDVSFVSSLFGIMGEEKKSRWLGRRMTQSLTRVMKAAGDCYKCSGDTAFDLFVKYENYVAGFPGFMFRRADWQQRQGFDESFPVAADYDFLCWLCSRGNVAFIPKTHFLRREHDENITKSEVPRLIDVIRILTRYISLEEMATRPDYRAALASKVVRLAQFFTLCGCFPQGRQMLRAYYQVRQQSTDVFLKPVRRVQLAFIKSLRWILGFSNLRPVTRQQASTTIRTLEILLADYGILKSDNPSLEDSPALQHIKTRRAA